MTSPELDSNQPFVSLQKQWTGDQQYKSQSINNTKLTTKHE
jgi:hypothetical protein